MFCIMEERQAKDLFLECHWKSTCACVQVFTSSKSKSYVSPVCMWCPRLASSLYDLRSSIWNRILSEHRITGIRLPLVALVHTISPSLRMANVCKHVVILSFSSKVWYCETWASHRVRSHGWCWQGSTFSRALCWSGRWNVGETWDTTFPKGFWFRKSYKTDFVEYVRVPVALKDGLARKALSTNPAVNVFQQEGAFKTKQSVQMIDFEVRVAVQEWYVSQCVQKERTANICKWL